MDSLGRNSRIYERISACEMTKVVSAGLAAGVPVGPRSPSDVAL